MCRDARARTARVEATSRHARPAQARSAYDAKMALVRDADVVCATCVGAGADLLDRFHFDRVLVDEAAQATEPVCVVPRCVQIKSSNRLQCARIRMF